MLSSWKPAATDNTNVTVHPQQFKNSFSNMSSGSKSTNSNVKALLVQTRERKRSQSIHTSNKTHCDLEIYGQQTLFINLAGEMGFSQSNTGLKKQNHPGEKGQPTGADSYILVIIHQHVEAEWLDSLIKFIRFDITRCIKWKLIQEKILIYWVASPRWDDFSKSDWVKIILFKNPAGKQTSVHTESSFKTQYVNVSL